MRVVSVFLTGVALLGAAVYLLSVAKPVRFDIPERGGADLANGAYMMAAAGCASCHAQNQGAPGDLSGGVLIASPFGAIITPNISPNPEYGIGAWSGNDFLNAVKRGVSPTGDHYYPAFPYTHYAGLTDRDVLDIKAYIFSFSPSKSQPPETHLPFPFNLRLGIGFWKRLNTVLTLPPNENHGHDRGRYLVEHAAHCGACHTPRNVALSLDQRRAFEGSTGFDGFVAPPLTPERLQTAGKDAFIYGVLTYGLRLDGAPLEAPTMIDVVDKTRQLTIEDRNAIYEYLTSIE